MGTYKTKVLIDENGESFMPITCEEAVIGGKYILSVFEAEKQTTNHYKITANNISSSNLLNKVVGLTFDNVSDASAPSFIQFNNETELPVYDCDGTTPLGINSFENIKYDQALIGEEVWAFEKLDGQNFCVKYSPKTKEFPCFGSRKC